MSFLQQFETHIASQRLFGREDLLILAVSGGSDSMVLTDLCRRSGYDFKLAHVNFQLRGAESNRDQKFIEDIAQSSGIHLFLNHFDTKAYAAEYKLSTQEAARKLRYDWLNQLADQLEKQYQKKTCILTAHHADDQTETLLINFFRGTGIKGLTGIPERNGKVVRPLLPFAKKQILEYAKEEHIKFVEDSSNLSSDYTRNYFRNDILPMIEKVYPSVRQTLKDNIQRFKETNDLLKITLKPILHKIIRVKDNEHHISIQTLFKYHNRSLIFELIHPFGFTERQIEEVLKLKNANSGSYIIAPKTNYRLIKNRHHFVIAPPAEISSAIITIQPDQTLVEYESGKLEIQLINNPNASVDFSSSIAMLDAKQITYPLILRKWKEGDYFYPLGMTKKKKIARFLIDQKLSVTAKENIWVLESNYRIIWIVGYRIDERCKVTSKTKNILKIENRM
jgi:tRNA(Ile)-lysidine synthase